MKIISGGQTGVDRAALDVAIHQGLPHGGWCPSGRRAEDGSIDAIYTLQETASRDYPCRTKWNVRDSDATLILHLGVPEGGTAYTIRCTEQLHKPCLSINLSLQPDTREVLEWLDKNEVTILNIAGPRESKQPGIYRNAHDFLMLVFDNTTPAPW
ncbi:MAG: hypothetical protein A2W28_00190 [Gammaproteobacteria bacterium RBG_16_51_14]|nr:MAG: hypothetical protein A2W28_00190 [Gammaproteobacteria bacterium RBG_16_51_14]